MNKSLIGALVVAMALLPSFASATTTAYDVDIGMTESYNAPGVVGTAPTLSQATGTASILNAQFVVDHWVVLVRCSSQSSADCTGDIVT